MPLWVLGADGDLVMKPMNPGLEAPHAGKDAGVTFSARLIRDGTPGGLEVDLL